MNLASVDFEWIMEALEGEEEGVKHMIDLILIFGFPPYILRLRLSHLYCYFINFHLTGL